MTDIKLLVSIAFSLMVIMGVINIALVFYFDAKAYKYRLKGFSGIAKRYSLYTNTLLCVGLVALALTAFVFIKTATGV